MLRADPLLPRFKESHNASRCCTAIYLDYEGARADPNHKVEVKPETKEKWCWFCLEDIREAAEQAELESALNNMSLGQTGGLEHKVDDISGLFSALETRK